MDYLFGKRRSKTSGSNELAMYEEEGEDVAESESKQFAQKSGFVSLKDRMTNLAEQTKRLHGDHQRTKGQISAPVDRQSTPQFATLHELFSSKFSSHHKPNCICMDCYSQQKKPKIPIMKLSKEDWNVKCWEERLGFHKKRYQGQLNMRDKAALDAASELGPNRQAKPEQQVEVFQGRIEDVAAKLEKVREGLPLDQKLYKLKLNKGRREMKSLHEWTDLLKQELERGVHHPTVLKSTLATIGASGRSDTRPPFKSPLGRPIRSIFQDDDDDDDNNNNDSDNNNAENGVLSPQS